ncbi:MAG TPA: 4-hydroxy-tetrahydrodipicolinate synthase [Gemmatimonadaceae bacterium]|nr:4-hydroxy-tetrahydrodipicolinate synthase [Gemmatimonadaceae bacterium]
MTASLRGAITAIVTPFTVDGKIDDDALGRFVEWQVAEGINGLVPIGSTGEAATMSLEERERVVRITVERAGGRVPVIAGAGSNDTAAAIDASRVLAKAGATHLLHVSPMYNKPPQRGLLAHFRAIADASPVPIVLYNVPGRTASNMLPETTLALAEHRNIVAVKEASGNLAQIEQILRNRRSGFTVLSGDDGMTLAVMAAGGEGVVSVISNIVPRLCADLTRLAASGDFAGARALHQRLAPLVEAAFVESNPIPAKAMLALMGRMQNVLRLPLVPLDARHMPQLKTALQSVGISA